MRVTHLSKMTHRTVTHGPATVTMTGTLCNRMVGAGDINCTTEETEVTCKLCIREIAWKKRREAA